MNKEVVRIARNLLGLSQKELGQLLNVTDSYVNYLENGGRRLTPNIKVKLMQIFVRNGLGQNELHTISELINTRKGVADAETDNRIKES